MYNTQLNNWGNSKAIRLPKYILDNAGIYANDEVEVEVLNKSIVIKKKKPSSIRELFEKSESQHYTYEEWDTGAPVAEEEI